MAIPIDCSGYVAARDACALASCIGLGINYVGWNKKPGSTEWDVPDGHWAGSYYVLAQLDFNRAVGLLQKYKETDRIYFQFLGGYTAVSHYCALNPPA